MPQRFSHRGFTLIELIVVVAIIGLLTAVAFPAYSSYIARSNRADARTTLQQAAHFMQRFYAANDSFAQTRSSPPVTSDSDMPQALKQSPTNGAAVYTLSVTAATNDAYTLTITPVAGGRMASDECGSYVLNSLGQGFNVKDGTTLSTEARNTCWK